MAQVNGSTVADLLETLTYNMCWSCGRATEAVSIPPPLYYAHLACERGKQYLLQRFLEDGATDTPAMKPKVGKSEVSKAEEKQPKSQEAQQKEMKVHE